MKVFSKKPVKTAILSLGLIALGVGFLVWGLTGILVHPDYAAEAASFEQLVTKQTIQPEFKRFMAENELYKEPPAKGEKIGSLSIPSLKLNFPIYEGTTEKEFKKGVGHYIKSVLPGELDNCVISGHRTTVFAKLGKLKVDNYLIIETKIGKYKYQVKKIRIVDKEDRTVIVPTEIATLTVTTCYPFRYIGSAPKRYILVAELVKDEE